MAVNSFPEMVNNRIDHLTLAISPGIAPIDEITALILDIYIVYKGWASTVFHDPAMQHHADNRGTVNKKTLDATIGRLHADYNFNITITAAS
jgi:hypothetical protein